MASDDAKQKKTDNTIMTTINSRRLALKKMVAIDRVSRKDYRWKFAAKHLIFSQQVNALYWN